MRRKMLATYIQRLLNSRKRSIVERLLNRSTLHKGRKLTREEMINMNKTKDDFKIPFQDLQKVSSFF